MTTALQDGVDAIYHILGIETNQEEALGGLKAKTPQARAETAAFLAPKQAGGPSRGCGRQAPRAQAWPPPGIPGWRLM
jgi:hypothetical protein